MDSRRDVAKQFVQDLFWWGATAALALMTAATVYCCVRYG